MFGRWRSKLISYKPFWETLKNKEITTYVLINKYGISSATIDRMKKGKGISTMKIDDFCRILECSVSDVIEYERE
jgi:DNA-binding Xre family transcriptional regulator